MDVSRSSAMSGEGSKHEVVTFCPNKVRIAGGKWGRSGSPKYGFLAYHRDKNTFVIYCQKKTGTEAGGVPVEQLKFRPSDVKKLGALKLPKGANYCIQLHPGTIGADEVMLIMIKEEEKQLLHDLLLELVGVKDTRSLVETKSSKSSQLRPTIRPMDNEEAMIPRVGDVQGSATSTAAAKEKTASVIRPCSKPSRGVVKQRTMDAEQPRSILSSARLDASARRVQFNDDETPAVPVQKSSINVASVSPVPFPFSASGRKRPANTPVLVSSPAASRKLASFDGTPARGYTPQRRSLGAPKSSPHYLPEENEMEKCQDPCGFLNLGLTCYMNAVLQCVFALDFSRELFDELRTYFAGEPPESKRKKIVDTAPFTMAFARLYGKKGDEGRRRSLLEEFKKQMVNSGKFKEEPNDEDAHEFFVFMLDQMQREVEALRNLAGVGNHPEELKTDAFNFHLEQAFSCSFCDKEYKFYDVGNHLILQCAEQDENRSELQTVADLLANVLGTGKESEDRECQACSNSMKLLSVDVSVKPRFLVLVLSRYSYDRDTDFRSKISSPVAILRSLYLSGDCQSTSSRRVSPPDSLPSPRPEDRPKSTPSQPHEDPFNRSFSSTSLPSGKSGSCEIVGVKERDQDKLYTPVDYEWRKGACSLLNVSQHFIEDKRKSAYEPYVVVDQVDPKYRPTQEAYSCSEVLGDGNCLFRALSHIITGGTEEAHLDIRHRICEFMELHHTHFERMMGKSEQQFNDYLSEMRQESTWGSDIELRACASLLRTTITTFIRGHWESYPPLRTSDEDSEGEQDGANKDSERRVVYLSNQHLHYDPVLSIPDRVKYRLRAIVNHIGESMDRGHYVNFLQDSKGQWSKFNDSSVDPCSIEEALEESTSTGYMLFYERRS